MNFPLLKTAVEKEKEKENYKVCCLNDGKRHKVYIEDLHAPINERREGFGYAVGKEGCRYQHRLKSRRRYVAQELE